MTDSGRIWKEWLPAIGLSLVLNILMFGALPGLMNRSGTSSVENVPLEPVNFVRLKRETPPVRRKPPPEKKEPQRTKKVKTRVTRPQRLPDLTIPFKPNRFQPLTPGAIAVPLARGLDLGASPFQGTWRVGDLDQPPDSPGTHPAGLPAASQTPGPRRMGCESNSWSARAVTLPGLRLWRRNRKNCLKTVSVAAF